MLGFRSDLWGGVPGFSAPAETFENAIFWGKVEQAVIVGALLDGTARDPTNTPTTVLRPGLVLGQITANGTLRDYGDANADGSNVATAVLLTSVRMVDLDGNSQPRFVWVAVGGPIQASKLIGLTEQARGAMNGRFFLDDRLYQGNSFGWRGAAAKTANYTVVNGTDNNLIFTTRGAGGAVTFTLPTTLQGGQRWRFFNEADQNMIVAAPAGKMVVFNNLAATSIAFQTAGEKIGGAFEVVVNDNASKYLVQVYLGTETQTPTIA